MHRLQRSHGPRGSHRVVSMKRTLFNELGSQDHCHHCTDDGLVHIIVYFESNSEWLRNCDLAFLAPVQVDVSEERTVTCLWCCVERSDAYRSDVWI